MRLEILKMLEKAKLEGKIDYFWYSHSLEEADIDFYIDGKERTYLSQPDIVMNNKGQSWVIEIELSNQPKHLLGVAMANNACDAGRQGKEKLEIYENKSLLIAVDDSDFQITKKGSSKPVQLEAVKQVITSYLDFENVEVIPFETSNIKSILKI